MTAIIMISGKMGVGKTTLQKGLVNQLGGEAMRFVSVLYEMHDACRDIARGYGLVFPNKFREFLETVGTEVFRKNLGHYYWIEALKSKIELTSSNLIIIDDARFPNEIDAFDSTHKVIKIRLDADEAVRRSRCSQWGDQNHISNTALDDYDFPFRLDVTELTEKEVLFLVLDYYKNEREKDGSNI